MALLPCGTALVCLQGKAQQSRMPDLGRILSQANNFLATDDIHTLMYMFLPGTMNCSPFIREEGVDVCSLYTPQSLQELQKPNLLRIQHKNKPCRNWVILCTGVECVL